jgi:hypothetical protein
MDDSSLNPPKPTGPSNDPFNEGPVAARARRMRSLGIALALIGFVVVVFIVSIIKMAHGG